MQTLARGSLAGLAATAPMTLVIALGRALGLMRTPPPVQITANAVESAGQSPDRQSPAFQAAWLTAHFGYGAGCGAIYALARPILPRSDTVAGVLFGGAVWTVSYMVMMPITRLYPTAADDSRSRQAVMIAAHMVFGATLAWAERQIPAHEAGTTPRPFSRSA